jgi:peroxiredoxin
VADQDGTPAIGAEAPDFELNDQHGTPVRLSGLRGTRNVVIVFYPFAFSRVCSGEMCELRDSFPEARLEDVELLAISVDTGFSLRTWADQQNFGFELLSDFWPHGAVARSYGVFDEKLGAAIRGTFIIDKNGVLRWKVIKPIPQARDIADYQKALAAL